MNSALTQLNHFREPRIHSNCGSEGYVTSYYLTHKEFEEIYNAIINGQKLKNVRLRKPTMEEVDYFKSLNHSFDEELELGKWTIMNRPEKTKQLLYAVESTKNGKLLGLFFNQYCGMDSW